MLRSLTAMIALSSLMLTVGVAKAQFIPKKPQDLIPKKPEDLGIKLPKPKIPQNDTQFSGQTKITFKYTILNTSNETVRFRLPSGQVYTLSQGQKGNYTFTGYKPSAKIHVFNTGRTYNLDGGDHKFWWMSKERQVGFDRDYKY